LYNIIARNARFLLRRGILNGRQGKIIFLIFLKPL